MPKYWENSKGSKQWYWLPERKEKQWSSDADASFYHTKGWRKTRAAFITAHPQCALCEKIGRLVKADVVDHIEPISFGGERFDWNNLQSLCHSCHNSKSARERHEHSQDTI